MRIGNVSFSQSSVVVIAEAGVNHLCDMNLADRLIREAASAGAHIIKFQTYKAEKLVTKSAPRFWDWEGELKVDGTQFDSYSELDKFGKDEHLELSRLCKKYGIEFMSTPFDIESAEMLKEMGCKGFKVASCDITNFPFLTELARLHLPLIMSTGASSITDIREAVDCIRGVASSLEIALLQCTLCYPTDDSDANICAISHLKREFPDMLIGLSDHTLGIEIPIASVALGARIIEKHFTVDKSLPKSADHWLSVDPSELKSIVVGAERVLKSLGHGEKLVLDCELPTYRNARRSLVTTGPVTAGDLIKSSDLTAKRPGTGISPRYAQLIVGKRWARSLPADSLISDNDVT